jgi:RNA polymerase sigma-54 factor
MADFGVHQSLNQQQSLAPQMRRSLEILQAGTAELSLILNQALETNPVLEDVTDVISLDALEADPEKVDSLASLNETEDDWRERGILEGRGLHDHGGDEERRQWLYESMVAPVTLQSHLQRQLDQSMVDPSVREAAMVLIGHLDSRGFLDGPLGELVMRMGMDPKAIEDALELVRSFDPPGVGAADVADSLALQLERRGEGRGVEAWIVRDHLEDLARKRYPHIAKALGISIERVAEAAEAIGRLTLNPGGAFDATANPQVTPDVVIEKNENGGFAARLTGDGLPQLRINDYYKDLLGHEGLDGQARQFLRDHLRDGRSLIRSIELRQETLLAIATAIVQRQPEFLERGQRHLRPMTMQELASDLGMHATTVSRAVSGKFIQTPHGLIEMRALFASGYQTQDGEEISNTGVREAIQAIVAAEDVSRPLSDEAIVRALRKQGVSVARRTVAKYRDQLGILPSHLRKQF